MPEPISLSQHLAQTSYLSNQIMVSRGISSAVLVGGQAEQLRVYPQYKTTVEPDLAGAEVWLNGKPGNKAFLIHVVPDIRATLDAATKLMTTGDFLFVMLADEASVNHCLTLVRTPGSIFRLYVLGDIGVLVLTVDHSWDLPHTAVSLTTQEFCARFPVTPPVIPAVVPSGKPVFGWFHVACMHGGHLIASEMHGQLEQSGLLARSSKIFVTLVGDAKHRADLKEYLFSRHGAKYEVILDSDDVTEFEWPSLKHMWAMSKDQDFLGYYVHTKGASNCRIDVSQRLQRNIRNWRYCMSHYVINKHAQNISALESGEIDACGPLFIHWDDVRYFAGNFWWATSRHLRRLPDPLILSGVHGTNRGEAEPWIGKAENGRYLNLFWCRCTDPYDFACAYPDEGPLPRSSWAL